MIVAKLGHPLNVTRRLLVVMPPLIHRHPGFFEAARAVKTVATQLGATMVGLVVDDDADRIAELFAPIKPAMPAQFEGVSGWTRLMHELRQRVRVDDLVVVLSARRGTLPWHPKLERLPTQLAGLLPESFLIFYPSEADTPRRDPVVPSVLPRGLQPDRIAFDLPPGPFEEALRSILSTGIEDPERRDAITAALKTALEAVREFRRVADDLSDALIAPDAYADVASSELPLRHEWRYFVAPDRVDAGQLDTLLPDLRRLASQYGTLSVGPVVTDRIVLRSGLPGVIDRYLAGPGELPRLHQVRRTVLAVKEGDVGVLHLPGLPRHRCERAVVVRCGGELAALPADAVEGIRAVASDGFAQAPKRASSCTCPTIPRRGRCGVATSRAP